MVQDILTPKEFFKALNKDTMHLVDEFYDENVQFFDPLVEVKNRKQMKDYYTNMYNNVESIQWDIPDEIRDGNKCSLAWKMTLTAKNFNKGKPVIVDGVSVIKFGGNEGKAIYHRDYFDLGEFVYEGIPILGGMVRFVKSKMANHHKPQ
jgi:hypothetical protein